MKFTIVFISFLLIFQACSNDDKVYLPEEGMVLYMPFNGDLTDKSINENSAEDFTSGNYVDGRKGRALDFDGENDYAVLTKNIATTEQMSFSFWVKLREPKTEENNGSIFSKYSMSENRRCILISTFNRYEDDVVNRLCAAFYKYGFSSNYHDHVKSYMVDKDIDEYPDETLWEVTNQKKIEVNKWTHCVVNLTADYLETWLDGVLCVKKKREYDSYYDSENEPICIGNNLAGGAGSNNHFNGVLDELRVYNRSLTEEEIRILYKY